MNIALGRNTWILLCTTALGVACTQLPDSTPEPAPDLASAPHALSLRVVDGTPSGSADDFALRVGGCSGALVAPRLVVTARHCVARLNPRAPGTRCNLQNASDPISSQTPGELLPTSELSIAVGPNASRRADVHVLQVDVDTSGDAAGCWRDVAVLTLDIPLALPVLPLRTTPVAPGERLRLVGYGNVDDNGTPAPGRRTRAELQVLDVGETTFIGPDGARHALLDDNVLTTAGACGGDSGGPVIDVAGALVGITHRGIGDCANGLTIYSGLARMKPLIALAAARIAPSDVPDAPDAGSPPADAGPGVADAGLGSDARTDPEATRDSATASACAMHEASGTWSFSLTLLLLGFALRRDRAA